MKTLEIIGTNYFGTWTKRRTACRGIVISADKVLLSYEENRDQYGISGGGLEGTESPEECCCREIGEETGIQIAVEAQFLTVKEYYEDWCYETHFFICHPIGETEKHLTERELQAGMVPRWVPLDEALSIFARHQEYAASDEEKRGIYLREYMALKEYADRQKRL